MTIRQTEPAIIIYEIKLNTRMALVSLNQLTKDAHSDFKKLWKKTHDKAMDYDKKHGRTDARREFFMTFFELNSWLLIQFDDFLITLNLNHSKITKYLTLSEGDRSTFLSQFDTINRSSYLAKCMFNVENYLKSIMKQLGLPYDDGYYVLSEKFLRALSLYDVQKFKILTLPSQVRNCLHNNGYTEYDIDVTLRGKNFQAQIGDQIKFSGWNNIYIMLDELTDLLIDLTDNSRINNEQHITMLYPN